MRNVSPSKPTASRRLGSSLRAFFAARDVISFMHSDPSFSPDDLFPITKKLESAMASHVIGVLSELDQNEALEILASLD